MKLCKLCGLTKPPSEYYTRSGSSTLHSYCKGCAAIVNADSARRSRARRHAARALVKTPTLADKTVGTRLGKLVVLAQMKRRALWILRCDCGEFVVAQLANLRARDRVASCWHCSPISRHGETHSPTWTTWQGMRNRCTCPSTAGWQRYGGRGIRVCARWDSYLNFVADMGERPAGSSLDRINNDGNYEPGNCRWATREEQARNTRTNRFIEVDGVSITLVEASQKYGVKERTIAYRLGCGWPVDRAVKQPSARGHSAQA